MHDLFLQEGFYFTPLGGSEQFGCNLNLYACDGELLAVDCGIGFADERFPGIDLLLPDPQILEDYKDNLSGMIITHAHEDHIGAVAYLWDRFRCPLYATRFTATVLRNKLEQEGVRDVPIHIVEPNGIIKIGELFDVTFLPVAHSIPESVSLCIGTQYGNVVHSGDWNLDPSPVVGNQTEEELFREIGSRKVLAYIGDSTNAQVEGYSGSESDVEKGLATEFETCTGKIAVTIFSSNIGRLISIARAARDVGRSVCLIGRSLHRMVGAAYECGYMKDIPDFIPEDDIALIPDENLVLVMTGSQGEHRAALARIARGDHKDVSLKKGDTVIFSSRAIPGNERNISTVKNNLSAAGVRIITPRDTKQIIHVSGHPCQEEILSMLQWIRPFCVIPVHGERLQLDAQALLAERAQVGHVVTPNNGSLIRLAPGEPKIEDHVETGILAVDQRRIIPLTHQSITARRKLQYSGTVHASLVLDHNLKHIGKIKINTVGLSCIREDDCIAGELEDVVLGCLNALENDFVREEEIEQNIMSALRRYVQDRLGLRPKTTVHVTILDL